MAQQQGKKASHIYNLAIVGISIALILKAIGYFLTESALIFADMSQSIVHLGMLSFAAFSLKYRSQPSRQNNQAQDNSTINLFTQGFEGALVIFAGIATIMVAAAKFFADEDIAFIEAGTILVFLSMIINSLVGISLYSHSQRSHDSTAKNNSQLIFISSAISLAVVACMLWHSTHDQQWLDQLISFVIAIYTLWLGSKVLRKSFDALIDKGDPIITRQLTEILSARCVSHNIQFNELKHVKTGEQNWVTLTLYFPHETEIGEAHRIASDIELCVISVLSNRAHIVITMRSAQ